MRKSGSGFTIVELLIVIVVVAILAMISVVAYRGIQNRAYDSAVQSDFRSIAQALQIYQVDAGAYPSSYAHLTSGTATVDPPNIKVSRSAYITGINNFIYCYGTSVNDYAVIAASKSGTAYYINGANPTPRVFEPSFSGSLSTLCPQVGASTLGQWGHSLDAWAAWIK